MHFYGVHSLYEYATLREIIQKFCEIPELRKLIKQATLFNKKKHQIYHIKKLKNQ